MDVRRTKKIVISALVMTLLAVMSIFAVGAVSNVTSKTNTMAYGTVSWSFSSTGANSQMQYCVWNKLAPSAGISAKSTFCGIAGKTQTEGHYEARYMGNICFANQRVIQHTITGNVINPTIVVGA